MINSKKKGSAGERDWRDQLRQEGYTARRGQQFSGSPDSPDVVCEELDKTIHFEVKRTERLNLYDAMTQAKADCGSKMPVVAHRRNHSEWLVVMRAEDWFKMLRNSDLIQPKPQP